MTTTSQPTELAVKALLGTKLGMTQVWDDAGRIVPVTVVKVGANVVTQIRTPQTDGYNAIQLGFGDVAPHRLTQPLRMRFEKLGITPKRHATEIRTSTAGGYTIGQELAADIFEAGEFVDVVGTTKGKGTAGVMKRHGFGGAFASHGAHRNHRKPGAIGGAATPGRVFKGKKMMGRMGNERRTVLNLKVHAADTDNGVLLITGAIPGAKGGLVVVRNAVKKGA